MEFDLSADQRALQAAARDLLAETATSARVRAVVDARSGIDRDLWKQMASQGWLALEVPEAGGGLGLSFMEVALLAEEVARFVAPAPFASTVLCLAALSRAPDDPVRSGWIDRLAAGEAIGCAVYGNELAIDAPIADVAVAVSADAVVMHDLSDGAPEVVPIMDVTRTAGRLEGNGVPIGGPELAAEMLDRGAAISAHALLGGSIRMLDASVAYAKVREQFGRPIGSFQAVKHRLADALVDVEGMRSSAAAAGWAVAARAADEGPDETDRALAVSVAKSWCSDAAGRVMDSCLQVHGGIGFTWEHDLHLYLKRAHLDARSFGTARFHRDRLATLLRQRVESGADLW